MTCDKCGVELQVGQWPFCKGNPAEHVNAVGFGERPLEPYWDDELGAEITTRAGRRAIMAEKHLEYHDVSKKLRGKVYVCMGGK